MSNNQNLSRRDKEAYRYATDIAHAEAVAVSGGQNAETPGYFVAFWNNFWGPFHQYLSRPRKQAQPLSEIDTKVASAREGFGQTDVVSERRFKPADWQQAEHAH